jgi:hypothetical protein
MLSAPQSQLKEKRRRKKRREDRRGKVADGSLSLFPLPSLSRSLLCACCRNGRLRGCYS